MNQQATDAMEGTYGPRSRKGVKYQRGELTRQRILNRAWEAFAARGFNGASMNEIAKAAEVTLAGLIFHYPNKIELFTSVLRAHEAADTDSLLSALGTEPTGFEVLDAFTRTARANAERYQFVLLTHLNNAESASSPDHPGRGFAQRHYQFSRQLVKDAFQRSIDSGEVRRDVDPEAIGIQVVAMSEGIENQWLQEPGCIDLAESFKTWAESLKSSLRP
ncbi:TetR/AcrR family transcriptional regulator [Paenarthrobacter sp. NPDC057981]|uniref:TetR/AcrR family transcriptional regulator n=1 Tax=Paenarthrobacter sp. NPDC057981 TaxID=3346297 RepID=UPI0036DBCEA2